MTSSPPALFVEFCSDASILAVGPSNSLANRQERYKVEASAEYPIERKGIKRNLEFNFCLCQAHSFEGTFPLVAGPVIVGQRHAMGSISNPVHQRESDTIPRIFGKMVFNY